jgi:hypothetical protein
MSDTPETDAEHAQFPMGGFTLDFARKLERERDRLAEALERVLEYQGRFAEEDPESIATEALAAVKGGSNDH